MRDTVDLQISKELIGPIIQSKINAAIIESIGEPAVFVNHVVEWVMKQKCDENGKVSDYERNNKYNLVDIMCRNVIRETVKDTLKEWVQDNRSLLVDSIKKELSRRPTALAKLLVNGFAELTQGEYRLDVKIEIPKPY